MSKSRIEVRERKKKDEHWIFSIDPWFDPDNEKRGFRGKITVSSQNELDKITAAGWARKWTKADVSWPSVGGADSWEISAFAEALRMAKEYAILMDVEHFAAEKK